MALWQSIPFACILLPLGSAAMTSVLKGKFARRWVFIVLTVVTALSACFTYFIWGYGESYTYMMGHFPAPWGNEIRGGLLEGITALFFSLIMLLSLLGGVKKLDDHVLHDKHSLYYVMILLLTAALMAQVYTNDAFTAYVFVEIMTIPACSLIDAADEGSYAGGGYPVHDYEPAGFRSVPAGHHPALRPDWPPAHEQHEGSGGGAAMPPGNTPCP